MRISELAERSGLSLATVKYYLREDVLHPGRKENARLAEYDETHLARLKLLRILRDVGDIPVDRLREIVAAVDDERLSLHDVFARAADATAPSATPAPTEGARAMSDEVIASAGWTDVRVDAADRDSLASVLGLIAAAHPGAVTPDSLRPYIEAADTIARTDIEHLAQQHGRTDLLESMVVGQVLFGRLIGVLRRLAEEHYSSARFRDRH